MSKSGNLAQLSSLYNTHDRPTVFYAEDVPYLPRILIFYWSVPGAGPASSASRVRLTILSTAGFRHFTPFSVAPSSSFYSAVHKLPDDKQRDDVCRAIAFALFRYFSELPVEVKNAITDQNLHHGPGARWGQSHAAQVACKMNRVINVNEVLESLQPFCKDRPKATVISAPPVSTSIRKTRPSYLPTEINALQQPAFGRYTSTTPSKRVSSVTNRSPSSVFKKPGLKVQKDNTEQLEALRFKMCEFVDTEDRYISRVQELIDLIISQGRTAKSINNKLTTSRSQHTVNAMLQFPGLLDQIKDANLAFLDDIESVLQNTEESSLSYIEQSPGQLSTAATQRQPHDPMGVTAFSKALLAHFPKFPVPYRDYLELHSQISSNLNDFFREDATSIQLAPSLLMEPAQRISRYSLYIDSMIPCVPQTSTVAIRTLEKARKIIAEICEMEPAASTILDSLRIEHESTKRSLSPTKILSSLTRANTTREAPAKTTLVNPGYATITGSLRGTPPIERDKPSFLPSLGRSYSKRNKPSRPGLTNVLSQQSFESVEQARSDENMRPKSGHGASNSLSQSLRNRFGLTSSSGNVDKQDRPPTSSSMHSSSQSPTRPGTGHSRINSIYEEPLQGQIDPHAQESPGRLREHSRDVLDNVEHYKAQVMRLEQENYKLLAENAELKRVVRQCTCGSALR